MTDRARGDVPELWGGVECTVNRVGDCYLDQLEFGGHARRVEDLDRIAALGIRTVRYPLLWERTAPEAPDPGRSSRGDPGFPLKSKVLAVTRALVRRCGRAEGDAWRRDAWGDWMTGAIPSWAR